MKKTFVVSGSSRGIGFELVNLIAAQGHNVFALSRNTETLIASETLHPIGIDITDVIALEKFLQILKEQKIVVDALINNAGTLLNQPFSETTKEDFEKIYSVNVFGLGQQ